MKIINQDISLMLRKGLLINLFLLMLFVLKTENSNATVISNHHIYQIEQAYTVNHQAVIINPATVNTNLNAIPACDLSIFKQNHDYFSINFFEEKSDLSIKNAGIIFRSIKPDIIHFTHTLYSLAGNTTPDLIS